MLKLDTDQSIPSVMARPCRCVAPTTCWTLLNYFEPSPSRIWCPQRFSLEWNWSGSITGSVDRPHLWDGRPWMDSCFGQAWLDIRTKQKKQISIQSHEGTMTWPALQFSKLSERKNLHYPTRRASGIAKISSDLEEQFIEESTYGWK